MEDMVSRTDKDRPYWVQKTDPDNQRFRHGRVPQEWDWFWKKMWPATRCWCCSNRHWDRFKGQVRSGWKREVRDMGEG